MSDFVSSVNAMKIEAVFFLAVLEIRQFSKLMNSFAVGLTFVSFITNSGLVYFYKANHTFIQLVIHRSLYLSSSQGLLKLCIVVDKLVSSECEIKSKSDTVSLTILCVWMRDIIKIWYCIPNYFVCLNEGYNQNPILYP